MWYCVHQNSSVHVLLTRLGRFRQEGPQRIPDQMSSRLRDRTRLRERRRNKRYRPLGHDFFAEDTRQRFTVVMGLNIECNGNLFR